MNTRGGLLVNGIINTDTTEIISPKCSIFRIDPIISIEQLKQIDKSANSEFVLLIISKCELSLKQFAYERISSLAKAIKSGIIYSDYFDIVDDIQVPHPLIDYQPGSVRDNFDFGHIMFFRKDVFSEALNGLVGDYKYAGLYNLRLNISIRYPIIRIPEYLYATCGTSQSDRQFDYVDIKNRDVQIEMEQVFTHYLKNTHSFISPHFHEIDLYKPVFNNEVSVIIPVKDRVRTILDSVNSALNQRTDFPFNVIVVDNKSTDGTTEILRGISYSNTNLIHLIPSGDNHGIGGCWNEGIHHPVCGRFAVQLDSDDIYSDENSLQKIVNVFRKEKCAMVIGSYKLTDFQFNIIPPGIIDHKEWTEQNGFNNALRINGFGAPRAFFTPIVREINFPDVSYGEDYAAGLAISRRFKIGRIYEPIYICRRWEGNSDSGLSIEKENSYNYYKDKIRTLEIFARENLNTGEYDGV